jgi:hypothetical protein
MTDPVPSKDQLRLWRQRVERYGGMQLTKPESLALFDEIQRLQGREREAFRLANAATYFVAPTYSLHAELKAFMDGQVGKPDDSTPEPPPSRELIDYGYAPGAYMSTCIDCTQRMEGVDKRCRVCKPCAEKRRDRATQPPGAAL